MILQHLEVVTTGPEETRMLGKLLGEQALAGLVVLLNGELGAGKTCFSQGVARGLDISAAVPITSPTYTLLNVHLGRLPLYHFDLYRLSQVDDLADLGYDEVAGGEGLTLVEWADRMNDTLLASITIDIEYLDDQRRRFLFQAADDHGRELLGQLAVKWSAC